MERQTSHIPNLEHALLQAARPARTRLLEIDVEKYQAYLDDPSLDVAQKEEIIHAIWTIIVAFVELGFGVHPTQQACGQVQKDLAPHANVESDKANPEDIELTQEFNKEPM